MEALTDATLQFDLAVRRSQAAHLRFQQVAERDLVKIYRKASQNIGRKVIAMSWETETGAGSLTGLKNLQRSLENEVEKLTAKTTKTITRYRDRSVTQGIREYSKAGTVYAGMFTKGVRIRASQNMFNKAYHRAIRFLQSPVSGIGLSQRVWDVNQIALRQMRRHMADGLLSGTPLNRLNQELRRFLLIPDSDMRFKRWRDFYKANPPGRGVYRSAYKNTERVLRTEMNRAYRNAAGELAKQMTWVKGMKWNLTAAHPFMDICDSLASQDLYSLGSGVYPPDAFPDSAHPHCLCYFTYVPNAKLVPKKVARRKGTAKKAAVKKATKVGYRGPLPGQFKTTAEAEKWLKATYDIHGDFAGLDIQALNPTLQQFDALSRKYPGVADRLKYMGTYRNMTPQLARKLGIPDDYVGYQWQGGVLAHASVNGDRIAMNPRWYDNFRELLGQAIEDHKVRSRMVRQNYINQAHTVGPTGTGVDHIGSIMTHEFGHQVNHQYYAAATWGAWKNSFIRKNFDDLKLPHDISLYAAANPAEGWAEAFTEMIHLPKAQWHKFTQRTQEFIKRSKATQRNFTKLDAIDTLGRNIDDLVTPIGVRPICADCKHLRDSRKTGKISCEAFPEGIPDDIFFGDFYHTAPHVGDRGLRFEPWKEGLLNMPTNDPEGPAGNNKGKGSARRTGSPYMPGEKSRL